MTLRNIKGSSGHEHVRNVLNVKETTTKVTWTILVQLQEKQVPFLLEISPPSSVLFRAKGATA